MERDDSGSGVTRKGEDQFRGSGAAGRVFVRDGGEGCGLTGLHVYAAEVNCSTEGAFDSRF